MLMMIVRFGYLCGEDDCSYLLIYLQVLIFIFLLQFGKSFYVFMVLKGYFFYGYCIKKLLILIFLFYFFRNFKELEVI